MKQLDFSKGYINESKKEPEMINEFLGTLLVCGVLGVVGSTAVLNVFKNISSLRTELVKLRNDRMQAKSSKMKAKLEREQSKRQYYLTKAGFSEDEIKKIMSGDNDKGNDKGNDKEGDNDIKELRGLLKKKEDDLSPRERKRLEELSDKVDSDDLSPKEQESLKAITGKSTDGENENEWPSTPEEQKEYDDWKKNLNDSKNKAYKSMMAYENAIKELPDDAEKEKHLKNLETMTAVVAGSADAEQVEQLEKISKETLPPEAQKLVDQVEKSADKISDEDLENWKKEKGITEFGMVKTIETTAEQNPKLLEEPKKDGEGEEPKKDGEGEEPKKDGEGEEPAKKDGEGEEPAKKDGEGETEEDDPQKDDERVDNDEDIEDLDYSNKDDLAKDPSTKYKQRTYKRGDKTFKTKSYYDKKGNSISKDDFMKMKKSYEERQAAKKDKKGKKKDEKNESFVGTPWKTTRLCETKKPAPVMEAEQGSDMESICKERLVYIKFVMDTTTNNVEKVKMERMYNAIYNCCFDANGKVRTMEDLYTYLNETMVENKGEIPGLPTNDQVVNIDDKCKAWRKTSPDKFDAYMARLNKENLDKAGTKKSDKAKDLLSPDKPDSNTEALDKIRDLSTKYGFTNILGLEPNRQASKEDDEKKDEVNKQQKDGSPDADNKDSKDVKADDVSPEQVDKIVGVSK